MISSPELWPDPKLLRWESLSLLAPWRAHTARSGVRKRSPGFLCGDNAPRISRRATANFVWREKAARKMDRPRELPPSRFATRCPRPSEAACVTLRLGHSATEREDYYRYRFAAVPPAEIAPRSADRLGWQRPPRWLFLLPECRSCCSCWKTERAGSRRHPGLVLRTSDALPGKLSPDALRRWKVRRPENSTRRHKRPREPWRAEDCDRSR